MSSVDLEGWLLSDSGPDSGYFFPSGIILPPDEYVVICKNLNDFFDFNPEVNNAVGDLPFGLSSSGDMIRLYDSESNVMDAVDYYTFYPWPQNAVQTGSSIELINPDLDNTQGENWQDSPLGGTPGRINSSLVSIENPVSVSVALNFECFPNPFRDYTTIQFTVATENHYRLEIFDINGKLLDVLVDEHLIPGTYYIDWFGNSASFGDESGGVFMVRLSTGNSVETIKLIKIK